MDKNLRIYYKSALAIGLNVSWLPFTDSLKICLGKTNYYFTTTLAPLNNGGSIVLCRQKHVVNHMLAQAGFPVPKTILLTKTEFDNHLLEQSLQELTFPLVAKPSRNPGHGIDVLCNIKTIDCLKKYLDKQFSKEAFPVQIEEFHTNLKEYRVLLLDNKVIGVVERTGARVIGDGIHTIDELIAISNQKRQKLSHNRSLWPLVVDDEYLNCLAEAKLTQTSIPAQGQIVKLCHTVNTGRGGDTVSLGKKIHADNAEYLSQVTRLTGLRLTGLDILCDDINLSFKKTKWLIIEANCSPDMTLHEIPVSGKKVAVTKKILRTLIYKHPLSYLYGLCFHSSYALYCKSVIITGLLLFMLCGIRF